MVQYQLNIQSKIEEHRSSADLEANYVNQQIYEVKNLIEKDLTNLVDKIKPKTHHPVKKEYLQLMVKNSIL